MKATQVAFKPQGAQVTMMDCKRISVHTCKEEPDVYQQRKATTQELQKLADALNSKRHC